MKRPISLSHSPEKWSKITPITPRLGLVQAYRSYHGCAYLLPLQRTTTGNGVASVGRMFFHHTSPMSLFISSQLRIQSWKIKFYNLTNEVTDGHYHTCGLLDTNLNYKINKVWEAGLTVTNLLNTTSYITTQYTGINTSRLPYPCATEKSWFTYK